MEEGFDGDGTSVTSVSFGGARVPEYTLTPISYQCQLTHLIRHGG